MHKKICIKKFINLNSITLIMVRFRCNNCNYSFTPKAQNRVPNRCPYCSDDRSLMEERSVLDNTGFQSDDSDME